MMSRRAALPIADFGASAPARLVKARTLGHTGRAGEVAEWLKAAVC
jgi:hypothetical protein